MSVKKIKPKIGHINNVKLKKHNISTTYQNNLLRYYIQKEKIQEFSNLYDKYRVIIGNKRTSYSSLLQNQINLNKDVIPSNLSPTELNRLLKDNARFFEKFATKGRMSEKMKKGYTVANILNELLAFLDDKYEGDVPWDDLNIEDNFILWVKKEEIIFSEANLINILNKMNLPQNKKDKIIFELNEYYYQLRNLRK